LGRFVDSGELINCPIINWVNEKSKLEHDF
jgi:hypothetical protein